MGDAGRFECRTGGVRNHIGYWHGGPGVERALIWLDMKSPWRFFGRAKRKRSAHSGLADLRFKDGSIPVILPCFNTVTYVLGMVEQLKKLHVEQIILVDNNSSFPAMVTYLAHVSSHLHVVALGENHGPRYPVENTASFEALPDYFCVTDPDLEFHPAMPDSFLADLADLTDRYKVGKAGLAIDIANPELLKDNLYRIGDDLFTIPEWEAKHWSEPCGATSFGDPIYRAPIDTTLAVYNKRYFDPKDSMRAVRVGGRYTCSHLPWYRKSSLPEAEEEFYCKTSRHSFYLRSNITDPLTTPR